LIFITIIITLSLKNYCHRMSTQLQLNNNNN
jgi:hypothetical protein